MAEKCPFCGEPAVRQAVCGTRYRCGTIGPDINDEYSTGRACDIHVWGKLLDAKNADIDRLRAERDALLACRRGEQRCHECPDTRCGDNTAEAGGEGR